MARISPTPKFRALDSNGDPLAGGKLYTYEAGTTTPKTTYTDNSEGTANANPVILDSDGYANVWLGAGSYKFVLDDANDVNIYTVDNIEGDAATSTSYAISTTTNIDSTYENGLLLCTSSPTLNLLEAAAAGDGFSFKVKNIGSGTVTIDPSASETIDGSATLTLSANQSALIVTDGSSWYSFYKISGDLTVTSLTASTVTASDFNAADLAGGEIRSQNDTLVATFGASNAAVFDPVGLKVNGSTVTIDNILDEDDMASDSATALATQQSIKQFTENRGFGAYTTPTSYSINTIYQWTGDNGILCIVYRATTGAQGVNIFKAKVGATSTPSDVVSASYLYGHASTYTTDGQIISVFMPLKTNDYFEVERTVIGATASLSVDSVKFFPINKAT